MSNRKPNRDVSARRRRMQEKGKIPWAYVIPALVVVVIILGLVYFEFNNHVATPSYQSPTVGNGDFPFSCLSQESLFFHIHPWLTITIDGNNVTIPPGIGIKNPVQVATYNGEPVFGGGANTCFEPIHTHDDSGVIHIESPTNTNYTLSNFFQIWAATYAYVNFSGSEHPIIFNSTDILGYKINSTPSASLKLLVDGHSPQPEDFQGSSTSQYGSLVLNVLDYCSQANSGSAPCHETAGGNPSWNGGANPYPYGLGHRIVIEYIS